MITRLTQLPGIGDTLATRITRHLGRGHEHLAVQAILSAPYSLTQVPRIGFRIADRVALFLGTHRDSPERHEQGNQFILGEDGTLPIHEFDRERQKLELTCFQHRRLGVVEDSGRVWLPQVLEDEMAFADWCTHLPLNQPPTLGPVQMTPELDALLGDLDEPQRRVVLHAIYGTNTRVMASTGGAGTGKTKVIGATARVARKAGLHVAVAAFAGKAADRIRESLAAAHAHAEYAGTIHKLLSYDGTAFRTGELPYDLVILDEASMITTNLLWAVARRLKPSARLLLVGDEGQLPPVGYGQPFTDLLTLGLPRLHLEHNYRSAHVQGIIRTANAIRARRTLTDPGDQSLELHVKTDLSDQANAVITSLRGAPLDDWQFITWKNDDAMAFNLAIQEELNPGGFPLFNFRAWGQERDWAEVREGDKVMVKANAYEYGVFNGQLGIALDTRVVETVHTRAPEDLSDWADADADGLIREVTRQLCVRVQISGEIVNIPAEEAAELLTLGYAITVHKAQGSDWETVVIYQPGAVLFDASRWWYTSVTRAKTRCVVLYEIKTKGGDGQSLWWVNTRRTQELGPSIFVGRVKKMQVQMLLPPTAPGRTGEEWLR